jgi:Ribbon-helix-helix protein, copG family
MRTTLTIDDDVAAMLKHLRRSRDASLKELINEALRRGLRDIDAPAKERKRYRTPSVDLGTPRIAKIDNISEVLAVIESTPSG